MCMSTFYRVLGVTSQADDAEIKLAFRRLAKVFHPDVNPGDVRAEQRFREIHRAYATLRDSLARAVYDRECAHERVRARRRWRSTTLTMSACFAITVISGLLVAAWMQVEARNRVSSEALEVLPVQERLPLSLGVSD
jgi:DnaJ-domain-containing protein 1